MAAGSGISFPDWNENLGFKNLLLPLILFPHTCDFTAFAESSPDVHLSRERVASIKVEKRSGSCPRDFILGLVGILQV